MPSFDPDDRIEIEDVRCVRATERAILVEHPDWEESQWIPHSQIDDESPVCDEGHFGTLIISRWIADQKGIV